MRAGSRLPARPPVHHGGPHAPPVRLRPLHRWTVYLLALALLATGIAWLVFEHYVRVAGDFGPTHHAAQPWMLKLHGALALFAVWGFGVLWTFHIRRAWRLRRHRRSGGTMFATVAALALSGLLLYYASDETLRAGASLLHWLLGLAGGVALVVHALIVPWRSARRGVAGADSAP